MQHHAHQICCMGARVSCSCRSRSRHGLVHRERVPLPVVIASASTLMLTDVVAPVVLIVLLACVPL